MVERLLYSSGFKIQAKEMVVQSFPLNSLSCLYLSLQTRRDRLLLLDHSLRNTALGNKKVVVKGSKKVSVI